MSSKPRVAFVVAHNIEEPTRVANWSWVRTHLETTFPDWPIYAEAGDPNKNRALNRAISRAGDVDIVIIYDADCFLAPTNLRRLVGAAVRDGWSIPSTGMVRLTRQVTARVLSSDPTKSAPRVTPASGEQWYLLQSNAFSGHLNPIPEPIGVFSVAALVAADGLDEYPSMSQEWWNGIAASTLFGPPTLIAADIWHLHHPVSYRRFTMRDCRRLVEYELAQGDAGAMGELIASGNLREKTVLRLMRRWSIEMDPERSDLVRDWLGVACMARIVRRPTDIPVEAVVSALREFRSQLREDPLPVTETGTGR